MKYEMTLTSNKMSNDSHAPQNTKMTLTIMVSARDTVTGSAIRPHILNPNAFLRTDRHVFRIPASNCPHTHTHILHCDTQTCRQTHTDWMHCNIQHTDIQTTLQNTTYSHRLHCRLQHTVTDTQTALSKTAYSHRHTDCTVKCNRQSQTAL